MRLWAIGAAVLIACAAGASAQEQPESSAPQQRAPDKRAFGVFPNYRTVDEVGPYRPITAKHKLWIASRDSFDYPVYFASALFAALYQLDNSNPNFGQGLKGYGKRYAAAYADQAIGNMMTEGLFPAMTREDPRYFRRGTGPGGARFRYAITRIFVTRTDAGGRRFNTSEVFGTASAVAISNLYYSGSRNAQDNVTKLGTQLATDAFANVMKEFWPDVKRRWFSGHKNTP